MHTHHRSARWLLGISEQRDQQLGQGPDGEALLVGREVDEGGRAQVELRGARRRRRQALRSGGFPGPGRSRAM
jgi:hypothetical protein